jgi:GH25 family lysozyme M1 (1,4-beta-N-acetylmuramidase)
MNARILDVSQNQIPARMRYRDWHGLGFAGAMRRIAVGLTLDPTADEHRRLQREAGLLTGGYSALRETDPMPAQCQLFIDHLPPDDELPAWADIERAGLTWRQVVAWLDHWDAHAGGRELWCYLNESVLSKMGAQKADRARLTRYGLAVSGYPFDAAAGPQPLDSDSIALRSNPPMHVRPLIPVPYDHYDSWQHTGHGRLPGYAGDLDLSVYAGTEAELRARFCGDPELALVAEHVAAIRALLGEV